MWYFWDHQWVFYLLWGVWFDDFQHHPIIYSETRILGGQYTREFLPARCKNINKVECIEKSSQNIFVFFCHGRELWELNSCSKRHEFNYCDRIILKILLRLPYFHLVGNRTSTGSLIGLQGASSNRPGWHADTVLVLLLLTSSWWCVKTFFLMWIISIMFRCAYIQCISEVECHSQNDEYFFLGIWDGKIGPFTPCLYGKCTLILVALILDIDELHLYHIPIT